MTERSALPISVRPCAWCGERKSPADMRHPSSSRGPTPSTCHKCREAHPDEGWCDFHERPHPRSEFHPINRPIGISNMCRAADSHRVSRKRGKPDRLCPSCDQKRESWYFRGGGNKSPVCRICEDANPDKRWCIECASWLDCDNFNRTGSDGKFWTVRCKTCRWANDHGITRERLNALLGENPRCAACGSTDDLKIDHDHNHCRAKRGCDECVRDILCHQCNTAEGLLRTPERARTLATYMERWAIRA